MSLIRILLEDFGDDADLDELNRIDRERIVYNQLVNKAHKKFDYIDGGSARKVFEYKDGTVVKVAYNEKGLRQNEYECELGQDTYATNMVAKVHYCAENFSFLIAEKTEEFRRHIFEDITGISFREFVDFISWINNYHGRLDNDAKLDPIIKEKVEESEFLQNFEAFVLNYGLTKIMGDFKVEQHWGFVERDGEKKVVLNDYGLTKEIFDKYYR